MLKELDIKKFLEENNLSYNENSSVWGMNTTKTSDIVAGSLFGPAIGVTLALRYNIIHFNSDGIAILGVDNITGKIKEDSLIFIKSENITNIIFNKNMVSYKLNIITTTGNVSYKINKIVIGASWHKNNLENILSRYKS